MNIIEAIKSGKRFKRPSYQDWRTYHGADRYFYFKESDLLANDWIIEEEKIPISKDELEYAYNQAQYYNSNFSPSHFQRICKLLGFKE